MNSSAPRPRTTCAHLDSKLFAHLPAWPFDCLSVYMSVLYAQLSKVNEAMNDVVGVDTSSAIQHTLQRHHDILQDYRQEFGKVKVSVLCSIKSQVDRGGMDYTTVRTGWTTPSSVSSRDINLKYLEALG